MPLIFWIGLAIGLATSLIWTLRPRRAVARAEFWIYSSSHEPLTPDALKASVRSLPGDLFGDAGFDVWTFSDVRFRLGDGDRRTMPHAFDPRVLDASAETIVALANADRVTKLLFAGPVAAEGFPLATITAAALAAARALAAERVWDHVARRGWAPAALAAACRSHGILSPEVHLAEEATSDDQSREITIRGFEKRALPDLRSLPFPTDLALVATETLRAYAAARWRGEAADFVYEAYGDVFLVNEKPRRNAPSVARVFRRQERG